MDFEARYIYMGESEALSERINVMQTKLDGWSAAFLLERLASEKQKLFPHRTVDKMAVKSPQPTQ